MSKNPTPADVAAKAEKNEETATPTETLNAPKVPNQAAAPESHSSEDGGDQSDEKVTFALRLKGIASKLKENKKALVALGVVAAVVVAGIVKSSSGVEVEEMDAEDQAELDAAREESEALSDNA